MIKEIGPQMLEQLKETRERMQEEMLSIDYHDTPAEDVKELTDLILMYSDVIIDLAEENIKLKKPNIHSTYNSNYLG